MFYEDIRVGESIDLGSTTFTRAAIVNYGQGFDPRVFVGLAPNTLAAKNSEKSSNSALYALGDARSREPLQSAAPD